MPSFRRYLIVMAIMIAIAVVLRFVFDISSAATLGVLLIGWPLVGTLVTSDDDLPGGWSNPDGTVVPEWKTSWWWADLLLVRGAVVLVAFVVEGVLRGELPTAQLVAAIVMMSLGLPIFLRGVRGRFASAK